MMMQIVHVSIPPPPGQDLPHLRPDPLLLHAGDSSGWSPDPGAVSRRRQNRDGEPDPAAVPPATPNAPQTFASPIPAVAPQWPHSQSAGDPTDIVWPGGDAGSPPPPGPASPAANEQPSPQFTTGELSSDALLARPSNIPSAGWRRTVYRATKGTVHPGESSADKRRRDLETRARTPVADGHHRIAVIGRKGGVGKTTVTAVLGSTLASLRGDRVIAVDANPDRGTLGDKVLLETHASIRDLAVPGARMRRYSDVRAFTSQNASRLEVLTSTRDPAVATEFTGGDYRAVAALLERFYSICLTDCGSGLVHSATGAVLRLADQMVLVTSPSVDGARDAFATLDWLDAHGHHSLAARSIVVISMTAIWRSHAVNLDVLEDHLGSRCRAVVRIPHDPHLEDGAEIDLDQLSLATRHAFLHLAAAVGDGFGHDRTDRTAP